MTDQTDRSGSGATYVIAQAFAEGTPVHEVDLLIAGDILRALESSGYRIVRADADQLSEATRAALTRLVDEAMSWQNLYREMAADVQHLAAILEPS